MQVISWPRWDHVCVSDLVLDVIVVVEILWPWLITQSEAREMRRYQDVLFKTYDGGADPFARITK